MHWAIMAINSEVTKPVLVPMSPFLQVLTQSVLISGTDTDTSFDAPLNMFQFTFQVESLSVPCFRSLYKLDANCYFFYFF